jgi:hypothetical protein
MPTFLPGVKPSSDSVADAWAKSAANVTGITNGNLDRERDIYKTKAALEQQEIENKRAQAVADMAKEKYDAEKATLLANKDYATRLQSVLSGESVYDYELNKGMSDAYTSTLAKTGSEDEARAAMSIVEAAGKKAILDNPVKLRQLAAQVSYSEGPNIDITNQVSLKNSLLSPLDKKIEQDITERDRKDKLDLDIKKMNIQERQFNQTLAASKQKSSGGGEDKTTDTEKKYIRTLGFVASRMYNKLSESERAQYAVTIKDKTGKEVVDLEASVNNFAKRNMAEIGPLVYKEMDSTTKAATPSTGGAKSIKYTDFFDEDQYGKAEENHNWYNEKLKKLNEVPVGVKRLYTEQNLRDVMTSGLIINPYFSGRTLDLNAADKALRAIIQANLGKE